MVKYAVLVLVVVLTVVMAWRILKAPERGGRAVACVIFAILIVALYAATVFFMTRDITKADVFIVLLGGIAAVLQTLNLIIVNVTMGRS